MRRRLAMDLKRLILLLSLTCSATRAFENEGENESEEKNALQLDSKCDLTGWWRGDSNSFMHIVEELPRGKTVEFEGVYYIRDQELPGSFPGSHPTEVSLRGAKPTNYTKSFGFVVSYKGGGTGVWVGQCLPDTDKERLETVWLFRTPSEYEDQWSATRVGKDKWAKVQQPEWYTHK